MKTLHELVQNSQRHPRVVGLVEYGSHTYTAVASEGDYDLLVLFSGYRPKVESLHFYVNEIPVDLNLRCLEDWQAGRLQSSFDHVLAQGRLIYQATPDVSDILEHFRREPPAETPPASQQAIASLRYGQKHMFDKIAGRHEAQPTLSQFLLYSNLYWLVQHYFTVRRLPYEGEKAAFAYLETHDPRVLQALEEIYEEQDWSRQVELARELNELVLEPVGGLWQDEEVLAFGTDEIVDLQAVGRAEFAYLFSEPS